MNVPLECGAARGARRGGIICAHVRSTLASVGPRPRPSPLPAGAEAETASAAATPSGAIHLDGIIDEPAWAAAAPIGPLVQLEPKEGVPASESTEVRVLFDSANLCFGITCHDRTPSAIVSTQLARDVGARADGQISNNSESLSFGRDGIGDARARRRTPRPPSLARPERRRRPPSCDDGVVS